MNWTRMLEIEPRLAAIASDALGARTSGSERVRWKAYGKAKEAARSLVGWGAEKPELRTSEAYETFCDGILKAIGL